MDEKESVVNHTVSIPSDLNSWAKAEVMRRRETGRYSMGELLRDGLRALQARGTIDPLRCDFGQVPSCVMQRVPLITAQALSLEEISNLGFSAEEVQAILHAENAGSNLRTPDAEVLDSGQSSGNERESGRGETQKTVPLANKPTASELAAKLGIKTGATIEEVEPRVDQDGGFISSEQAALTEDELKIEESRQRFGVEATSRMLKLRPQMNRKGIKTWDQIFEVMQEQKERE